MQRAPRKDCGAKPYLHLRILASAPLKHAMREGKQTGAKAFVNVVRAHHKYWKLCDTRR